MRSYKKGSLVHKKIVATVIAILIVFLGFNLRSITVHADTTDNYTYTSIQIKHNDSLWTIADRYCPDNMNISEYISIIKESNSIDSNHIVEGNYLLIPVYE